MGLSSLAMTHLQALVVPTLLLSTIRAGVLRISQLKVVSILRPVRTWEAGGRWKCDICRYVSKLNMRVGVEQLREVPRGYTDHSDSPVAVHWEAVSL